jgi:hypothetical protein
MGDNCPLSDYKPYWLLSLMMGRACMGDNHEAFVLRGMDVGNVVGTPPGLDTCSLRKVPAGKDHI